MRDAALGRRAADVDVAAGPRCARFVSALAARFGRRAFRFRKRGVTTWRIVLDGREVDVVDVGRRGFARDLARRDFTVNAVAFDPVAGEVEDPSAAARPPARAAARSRAQDVPRRSRACAPRRALPGRLPGLAAAPGQRRRRHGRGACPGPRFRGTDPRRAAGAAARPRPPPRPARPPAPPSPSLGPSGARSHDRLRGGPPSPRRLLASGDVLAAATRAPIATEEERAVLRWALLLHDVSKPETLQVRADGRPTFHGHEVLGALRAEAVLRRLKTPCPLAA